MARREATGHRSEDTSDPVFWKLWKEPMPGRAARCCQWLLLPLWWLRANEDGAGMSSLRSRPSRGSQDAAVAPQQHPPPLPQDPEHPRLPWAERWDTTTFRAAPCKHLSSPCSEPAGKSTVSGPESCPRHLGTDTFLCQPANTSRTNPSPPGSAFFAGYNRVQLIVIEASLLP